MLGIEQTKEQHRQQQGQIYYFIQTNAVPIIQPNINVHEIHKVTDSSSLFKQAIFIDDFHF